MKKYPGKEANGVIRNLTNGFRLLQFKRIETHEFYVSHDQPVILAILLVAIFFIGSLILSLPEPEFNAYGMASVATELFLCAVGVYLFSKLPGNKIGLLPLFVILLSLFPYFHLGWLIIGGDVSFYYGYFYGGTQYLYIIFNIWVITVIVVTVSRVITANKKVMFLVFMTSVVIIGVPMNYIASDDFWYSSNDNEEEPVTKTSINEESTYYKQFKLIEMEKVHLLPQRNGISDMYFVGFGSYADQDVFMKEVLYAKKVMDEAYDTMGRSVAMINNEKTLNDILLASKSNLTLMLEHIGKVIDVNDDILFLYLTSHGSKQHQLSVTQSPLVLNKIGPSDLKAALDNSGIKYRILLVSACYSGGFIEPLMDDYTVVFTASAKDKKSFGCSNSNDFTYFGQAIFKDNLEHNFNLIGAFRKAIEKIRIREQAEKLEPSDPQLYIGYKIREKLQHFSGEIENYNQKTISGNLNK